jgi:hypothetical protein
MKQINALFITRRLLLACAVSVLAACVSVAAQTPSGNAQQPGAAGDAGAKAGEKPSDKPSALDEELSKTPAGKTVAKFFAAFNSGDIKVMRAFHESTGGNPENADKDFEFYERTGGLKPHRLSSADKEKLSVLVQTKKDARWLNFDFTVSATEPYGIEIINVSPGAPPAN